MKTKDFFSRLAYCLHVSGENCHRRRIFPKTRSRFFQNVGLLFSCGLSLRANSPGRSDGAAGAGKGRRACNYVSGIILNVCIEYEMLIGRDDISIDVITLVTCFSMVVYTRARFRFALTAQSKGSHRGIGGGIQILFQGCSCMLSFLSSAR